LETLGTVQRTPSSINAQQRYRPLSGEQSGEEKYSPYRNGSNILRTTPENYMKAFHL
jgi:hypothetical protein